MLASGESYERRCEVNIELARAIKAGAERAIHELGMNDQKGFVSGAVFAAADKARSALRNLWNAADAWEKKQIAEGYE